MTFTPQGSSVAYRWNEFVRCRSKDGSATAEYNAKDKWVSARFSYSGAFLAIGTTSGKVKYFNTNLEGDAAFIGERQGRFHHGVAQGACVTVHSLWSKKLPENTKGEFNLVRWKNKVLIFKITEEEVDNETELDHEGDICDMAFCNDGKILLVGTTKDVYSVWDFYRERKIKEIKGVSFSSQLLTNLRATFAPDNNAVALMGDGKKCLIYDTAELAQHDSDSPRRVTPQNPKVVLEPETKSVSIVWSPDCKKILLGSWFESFVLDVNTKQ